MIDLRSDFLSQPTPDMVAAMEAATHCESGYGPREDPNQQALETFASRLLGKEDALFVPTCTMANLLAVMAVARRGDAVLLDEQSHVLTAESGALAALAGVVTRPLASHRGRIPPASLAGAVDAGSLQKPRTRCLLLENTHNKAGGIALPRAYFDEARVIVGPEVWLHIDGSRLFNAAVALGVPAASLVDSADSVSISLNKGLGAPVGAVLAGPAAFITEATRLRQQLGGGWRPVGMLAAAARVGLETMVARMAQDHAHARRIAEVLVGCGVALDLESVQTNIVRARLPSHLKPAAFEAAMADAGVRLQVADDGGFRLVTYPGIDATAVERACAAFLQVLAGKEGP